jgi:uncharacterized protein
MDRRKFIKDLTALGVAAGVARISGVVPQTWAAPEKGQIPYHQLGSTGEKVSIVGLGGFHLGRPDEPESIRIVRTATGLFRTRRPPPPIPSPSRYG